jgi:hypothetical protein
VLNLQDLGVCEMAYLVMWIAFHQPVEVFGRVWVQESEHRREPLTRRICVRSQRLASLGQA